jgi:hypothetical protein
MEALFMKSQAAQVPPPFSLRLPLQVAPIENKDRLISIYSELKGWQIQAGEESNEILDNYYWISKKLSEVILAKMEALEDKIACKKFKKYTILAAYDTEGHLQGVAALKMLKNVVAEKKQISAKVDFMVTAFWNFPNSQHKQELATRGVGTCLLQRLIEILPTSGAIFLETTFEALLFFEKVGFQKVESWKVKTLGAYCGLALYPKDFASIKKKTVAQITSCNETALPKTVKHYLSYLPPALRQRAEISQF